jgi:hypothetical protein
VAKDDVSTSLLPVESVLLNATRWTVTSSPTASRLELQLIQSDVVPQVSNPLERISLLITNPISSKFRN